MDFYHIQNLRPRWTQSDIWIDNALETIQAETITELKDTGSLWSVSKDVVCTLYVGVAPQRYGQLSKYCYVLMFHTVIRPEEEIACFVFEHLHQASSEIKSIMKGCKEIFLKEYSNL